SWLPPGSVSALSYGNKLVGMLLGLGVSAVGTAVLPHFSRIAVRGDWAAVRRAYYTYSKVLLALALPVTLVLIIGSEWIVGLVFRHGMFSTQDAHAVGRIQAL